MKKILKNAAYLGIVAGLMIIALDPVMAQGIKRVTDTVKGQLPEVADVLAIVSYIAGIGLGIKAALKLKESNESKGQVPLSTPITLAVVAGALLALPTLLTVATEGLFGSGSTKVNAAGTGLRSIN